jgi:hypothetical protein
LSGSSVANTDLLVVCAHDRDVHHAIDLDVDVVDREALMPRNREALLAQVVDVDTAGAVPTATSTPAANLAPGPELRDPSAVVGAWNAAPSTSSG